MPVGAPELMLVYNLPNDAHIHETPARRVLGKKSFTREFNQATAQPRLCRHRKSLFGAIDNGFRKHASHRLAQEKLSVLSMKLEMFRQPGRKFQELVI